MSDELVQRLAGPGRVTTPPASESDEPPAVFVAGAHDPLPTGNNAVVTAAISPPSPAPPVLSGNSLTFAADSITAAATAPLTLTSVIPQQATPGTVIRPPVAQLFGGFD